MPLIHVKLVDDTFDSAQKQELLAKLTDAVESVYPGLRDVTFVTIEEIQEGGWGIGGQPMTARKVAEHAKQSTGR